MAESGAAETKKMVTLVTQDGESFEVSEAAVSLSRTIALSMEDDDCAGGNIPLPNVDSKTLAKILEYLNKHAPAAASDDSTEAAAATSGESSEEAAAAAAAAAAFKSKEEKMQSFDAEFIDVDQSVLYNLFMAANYLDIKGLLDLCAQKVADMIKGKMPEEIRETFGIKNDFKPDEEAEIRKENAWAFQH